MVTLNLLTTIDAPIERCFDLSRSVEVHLLGTAKTGEKAVGGVTSGLIGPGEFVRWRATHLGVRQHQTSMITEYDRPHAFQDTMIEVRLPGCSTIISFAALAGANRITRCLSICGSARLAWKGRRRAGAAALYDDLSSEA